MSWIQAVREWAGIPRDPPMIISAIDGQAYDRWKEWHEHRVKKQEEALARIPIGSLVQLKSGGPAMTTAGYSMDQDGFWVIWTTGGVVRRDCIGESVLVLVPAPT